MVAEHLGPFLWVWAAGALAGAGPKPHCRHSYTSRCVSVGLSSGAQAFQLVALWV